VWQIPSTPSEEDKQMVGNEEKDLTGGRITRRKETRQWIVFQEGRSKKECLKEGRSFWAKD
jgi:hypothetical protein